MGDSNTVIAATLKVDASSAVAASKSIVEMKDNIKELQKVFEQTKAGSKEQAEAFKNLKAAQDELNTTTKNLNKTVEESAGHFENLKKGLGGVNPAAAGATEGVGKLNSIFKLLASNPLVLVLTLIVGALTLLYKAFTNTFEGAEKVEQIFAGVKAAAQALFDDLGHIAKAIADFFTFDFSGAADEIAQVVSDVENAYTAMSNLTKQAQELHKEQLKADVEAATRQKELAILREQTTDDSVPAAKRKILLEELRKITDENGQKDIELAKKITENKIAQLTLEKDGIRKNQDEIAKLRIEQINAETNHANELRRIDKQLNIANKQDEAEQAAAAKAAAEARKKLAEEYAAFLKQLHTIQNENDLLQITEANEKELAALRQKFTDEQKILEGNLKARKISQDQFDKLNEALILNTQLKEDALTEKQNKAKVDKEATFQKELAGIKDKIAIDSIIDTRERERVQLNIGYEEKLNDAIKRYKDDQTKLQQIKEALQAQLAADQAKLDAKNLKADQKLGFEQSESKNKAIIDTHNFEFDAKKAALDAQQQLVQDAYDQQIISEKDYNSKTAELANARKTIRDEERQHSATIVNAIGDGLETLAELAGKQTAVGKALAIASTTIKTFQSAISAFAGIVEEIPGPVGIALGVVAAAGAVATGIKAVKNIIAVKIPGGHDVNGSAPTGLPTQSAPVAPTQSGTKIDQKSIAGIGDATSGRVYVLDSDVQNSADRNARLNRQARLGG